ncbi:MAG: hypothetical protein ACO1TE_22420 [Prosthecobacter sp.]
MAWQLIYTSAPRLLEAGRTGFGTVARHRAVGGPLAAAVERLSQFARLPGHDPKRVVFAHRIVTAGGVDYHVLSCLRDAGSDYTGRTNHIAHHLIAEQEEVRPLAAAGISPADVLLAMPWRSSWSGTARFLDPADEVALATLRAGPAGQGQAWAGITGDQRLARLPWTPAARAGCYLITPAGAPVLELFRESLREMMSHAWQATFTTSLEPNDDVEDFRWIAVDADSPLRTQLENSARPVFDLLQPASLSLPQPPEQTPLPAPEPEAVDGPAVPSVRVPRRSLSLPPEEITPAAPATSILGGWLPEPRVARPKPRPEQRRPARPLLMAAGVAVLLAGALLTGRHFFSQRAEKSKADAHLQEQIETTWQRQGLRLDETRRWLARTAEDPARGEQLVREHLALLQDIQECLAGRRARQVAGFPVETRDDLRSLASAVAAWLDFEAAQAAPAWNAESPPALMKADVESWQQRRREAWEAVSGHFTTQRPLPAATAGTQRFSSTALILLSRGSRPRGTAAEWLALFEALEQRKSEVPAWLPQWARLDSLDENASLAELRRVSDALSITAEVPVWLNVEAARRQKAAVAAVATVAEPEAEAEKPVPGASVEISSPPPELEDADAVDAAHPIILVLAPGGDSLSEALGADGLRLQDEPLPAEMQVYFGDLSQAASFVWTGESTDVAAHDELKRWSGIPLGGLKMSYAESFQKAAPGSTIEFQPADSSLCALPSRPAGARLLGRSADGAQVLFDVRFKASASTAAEVMAFSPPLAVRMVDYGQGMVLPRLGTLLRRLRIFHLRRQTPAGGGWVLSELAEPQFELMESSPQGGKRHRLAMSGPVAGLERPDDASTEAVAVALQRERDRLVKERTENIRSVERVRDSVMRDNPKLRSKGDKEKVARYNAQIASRKAELARFLQMPNIRLSPPIMPRLPPGEYILVEKGDSTTRICKVLLQESGAP